MWDIFMQAVQNITAENAKFAALIYTHTYTFNGPFSGTTQVSRYQKGKPIWILLKQETVSGSGIHWAICKSAPRSRQTTMPAPYHSQFFTGRMPFHPPNQQRQSTKGKFAALIVQCFEVPSVLCRCWLGGRKGIRPVKNRVVWYWHGYLSGARCRLAYGPADATATHCLLLQ